MGGSTGTLVTIPSLPIHRQANLRAGERIAKCPSCSLRIRVVVPEDRAEGKEEDKEEKAS